MFFCRKNALFLPIFFVSGFLLKTGRRRLTVAVFPSVAWETVSPRFIATRVLPRRTKISENLFSVEFPRFIGFGGRMSYILSSADSKTQFQKEKKRRRDCIGFVLR
ncbi:hypothetical protein PORY_001966 [Pneumocystis oryctolagi]|uniref:Uncharacterized protein n=1 Tax=Pneumocystis oryctolagi TaxID=42067 RepID=A0ACB7CAI5_9ASCO|nr:hypothetical protein PORY_001966 [Pneumocystis oryctolagi]